MNLNKVTYMIGLAGIILVNGAVLALNRVPTPLEIHLEIVAIALLILGKEANP